MSYNSYKTSPSYGSSGYSRGRGGYSTRGSYRGRGAESSSSWGSSSTSRGRGYSGPSRGRFNWQKEYSSDGYDSRSRYASASSGVERYSSRGRGDDTGYRHYSSRADTSDYTSPREVRDPRSPDSTRKRLRTEHGYVQASSTRRSHEGGYGGSSDYSSRYSYPEDKGSYGEDRSRGYRDDRRSTTAYRSREEYSHRKAEAMESSMPPPSSLPPRHVSTPRGSFRGRLSTRGVRGMSRMMIPKRTSALLTRKRSFADSYIARKRMLTARTQAENLRRMRIIKLRRLREAAAAKKEDSSKETEDISDEEDEDKDEEEGELEEGETAEKKESPKKAKVVKKVKNEEPEEGEEVEEEDEDEEKKETKANGDVHVTIKQDSDAKAVGEEEPVRRTFTGKPFIKLVCPHCLTQAVTFQEYTMHFHTNRHINSMRKQSLKHKQTLADMRMSQRQKQRVIEEKEEARGTLSERTKFCHICKLNYRQLKSKHMASEYHQEMVKFLMPICYVCEIEFKSPMLYENHICSLDHIKRKAAKTERQKRRVERLKEDEKKTADEDDKDVNLDNFMILDSVGDVDDSAEEEDEEEEEEEEEGEEKSEEAKEEKKKKKKKTDNLGIEHVKTVEVYYCDLCSQYLPRSINPDRALAAHCRTRSHLQRYVRHRDDELLRKEAERIHRKRLAKKGAAKEAGAKKSTGEKDAEKMDEDKDESIDKGSTKHSEDSAGESPKKKKEASSEASQGADRSSETVGESRDDLEQDLEAGMDDKLWADVDKDLGELLREVEPGNKSSDEDDDSHAGGRYDRFRYSEKGNANAKGDATKTGDENATEVDPEDDKEKKTESEGDVPAKKASAATPTPVAAVN